MTHPIPLFESLPRAARFDLHMHTTRSDGRFDAAEVLLRCAAGGLDVVSITDHDLSTEADFTGLHRVGGQRIVVLGGAEVSGCHDGYEFHLLVYFPHRVPVAFARFCQAQAVERAHRYEKAIDILGLDGLTEPDAHAHAGERALTRFHLAQELVNAGHADDTGDAFARFLGHRHGNVPHLQLTFTDAIRMARALGGVVSWAHPPADAMKRYLPTFVAAGLQGLEGIRPFLTSSDRKVYRNAARRHGLFLSGGSDFHGWRDADDLGLFFVEEQRLGGLLGSLRKAA